MKLLSHICRLLVGSLFIVSGLIKANDPLGFSFKLHDYFQEDVLDLMVFEPYALLLAVIICVAEIVLGLAVMLRAKRLLTSITLLVLIIFFTFLTWYSHTYDKVTDCGCFGDALKLTPYQSFLKDVVLLVLIVVIFLEDLFFRPKGGDASIDGATRKSWMDNEVITLPISLVLIAIFSLGVISWAGPVIFSAVLFAVAIAFRRKWSTDMGDWVLAGVAVLISTAFSLYTINYLPIRDYRPYAVGKSISEGIKTADEFDDGRQPPRYAYLWPAKLLASGKDTIIRSDDYMEQKLWENKDIELVKQDEYEQLLVEEGYEPPIHDFVLEADGSDVTRDVLAEKSTLMLFSRDIENASRANKDQIAALAKAVQQTGGTMVVISNSGPADLAAFTEEFGIAGSRTFSMDLTAVKTVVRANPGLLWVKEGTVVGKWHNNALPDVSEITGE